MTQKAAMLPMTYGGTARAHVSRATYAVLFQIDSTGVRASQLSGSTAEIFMGCDLSAGFFQTTA